MPQFRYTARRSDGQLAHGVVEANDRAGRVTAGRAAAVFPDQDRSRRPRGEAGPKGTGSEGGRPGPGKNRHPSRCRARAKHIAFRAISLYRAIGPFALRRDDAGRGARHSRETDAAAGASGALQDPAPGAGGWAEPLAGDAPVPEGIQPALYKHGFCRRGERRAPDHHETPGALPGGSEGAARTGCSRHWSIRRCWSWPASR